MPIEPQLLSSGHFSGHVTRMTAFQALTVKAVTATVNCSSGNPARQVDRGGLGTGRRLGLAVTVV
jgi:hypothetical protein